MNVPKLLPFTKHLLILFATSIIILSSMAYATPSLNITGTSWSNPSEHSAYQSGSTEYWGSSKKVSKNSSYDFVANSPAENTNTSVSTATFDIGKFTYNNNSSAGRMDSIDLNITANIGGNDVSFVLTINADELTECTKYNPHNKCIGQSSYDNLTISSSNLDNEFTVGDNIYTLSKVVFDTNPNPFKVLNSNQNTSGISHILVSFSVAPTTLNQNPSGSNPNPTVPEPTSWMIMLQGLGLLSFVMFRRRSQTELTIMTV
ncbi:PEP-CTERM sorting domain-containing protein [Candidatus Nitrosacidococcus sp. I8]|uniref:PEP-CTERM sorting domain-containing protein n=1 Tax=Candidatus Nitrosacidococcus sp. I8 TaxID=2942908 RepID=UPI0022262FCB|nr:PEP-CTERM sorting domain-containing protein [Candidatus Nitrosacidococcus sp. I8]CAH9019023.1 hypothetical protein NURINAE_01283 [Candidatus Nitrosacidococcus sp. I8]